RLILSKDDCITVWLNPAWHVLEKHLEHSSKRPLLDKLTFEELQILYKKRIPYYQECADIVLNDLKLDVLASSIEIYKKLHDI
ncbi:shikimate kinase, partial [Candidatus Cloacimonadota bacterium]